MTDQYDPTVLGDEDGGYDEDDDVGTDDDGADDVSTLLKELSEYSTPEDTDDESDTDQQEGTNAVQPRVPNIQQADLQEYLREEIYSEDPDRMAAAIEYAVNEKVSTAINNLMELQSVFDPDPNEAFAKRLVTQALAANPEVAKDPHLMSRARLIAAVTNSHDPVAAVVEVLRKTRSTAAPGARGGRVPPESGERTPRTNGNRRGGTVRGKPEDVLSQKLGLPKDYIDRLNLK